MQDEMGAELPLIQVFNVKQGRVPYCTLSCGRPGERVQS